MKRFFASFTALVLSLNVLLGSVSQVSATIPTDLASLALWMQGDNFNDGTNVWSDSSTHARHTTSGTASDGPLLNGHKAVHFGGADALIVPAFAFEPSADGTVFVVYGNVANTAGTFFSKYNGGAIVGWDFHISATGIVRGRIADNGGGNFLKPDDANDTSDATFHFASAVYDAQGPMTGQVDLRVDGNLTTDSMPTGTRASDQAGVVESIGGIGPTLALAERKLTGDIWELIVFTEALSGTDRAGIEAYLQNKYAPIPEPSTAMLMGLGALGLIARSKRKRNR